MVLFLKAGGGQVISGQLRGLGSRGYFKTAPLCSPCHESLLPISPRALLGSGSSLKVLPDLKHVDVVAFQERLFQ